MGFGAGSIAVIIINKVEREVRLFRILYNVDKDR